MFFRKGLESYVYMEASILYESTEDWEVFREKHQFIDLQLPLPRLQIIDRTNEVRYIWSVIG